MTEKPKTSYRLARMRRGLTQTEAARLIGIGQVALSAIETGRSQPKLETAIAMAKLYGCNLTELVTSDNAKPSDVEEAG